MDNHVVGGEALRHGAADADVTSRRAHPRGACSLQRGQRFSSRAHRCFLLRVSFPAGEVLRSASQRTIPYKDPCTWGPQITVAFKLSQPGPLQRSVGWRAFSFFRRAAPDYGSRALCTPLHGPITGHICVGDHRSLWSKGLRHPGPITEPWSGELLTRRSRQIQESFFLHIRSVYFCFSLLF